VVVPEGELRQRESVQRIRNGIEPALELIENLIELARGEAGQLAMRTEEVDVVALAEETGWTSVRCWATSSPKP
jgi:signal transduction histidine kinase